MKSETVSGDEICPDCRAEVVPSGGAHGGLTYAPASPETRQPLTFTAMCRCDGRRWSRRGEEEHWSSPDDVGAVT